MTVLGQEKRFRLGAVQTPKDARAKKQFRKKLTVRSFGQRIRDALRRALPTRREKLAFDIEDRQVRRQVREEAARKKAEAEAAKTAAKAVAGEGEAGASERQAPPPEPVGE